MNPEVLEIEKEIEEEDPFTHYAVRYRDGTFNFNKALCGAELQGRFHPNKEIADCVVCLDLASQGW